MNSRRNRFRDDPRYAVALSTRIESLMPRMPQLDHLRRGSGGWVGACPNCGGDDRFAINTQKNMFNCRKCDTAGKTALSFVQQILNLNGYEALTFIAGDREAYYDPEKAAKLRRKAERDRTRLEAEAARYRQAAIHDARRIWRASSREDLAMIQAYFALRGIPEDCLPDIPVTLRFHPELPYVVHTRSGWDVIHTGPAMVAGVFDGLNRITGVHRTWLDLSQADGKRLITFEGKRQKPKRTRGSVKGHHIALVPPKNSRTLVLAEGIETTLSAYVASGLEGAAYGAGISLDNMAGRMQRQTGVKWSGRPDMSDLQAYVPPSWVDRLIFVMDGDSNANMTRAKLESGLKRALEIYPELTAEIVAAEPGLDLNDMLKGAAA